MPGAGLNGATKDLKTEVYYCYLLIKTNPLILFGFLSFMNWDTYITKTSFLIEMIRRVMMKKRKRQIDLQNFIPEDKYSEFVSRKDFSPNSVVSFAKEMGVIPSIVIGRIRNDNLIDYQDRGLNSLGTKYEIVKDFSPI